MIVGLIFTGRHLEPLDATDLQTLESVYGAGETVMIDVKKARNLAHHRKLFAILQLALDNTERYDNVEDLLVEIKIMIGHYREYITQRGEIVYVPKSVSFEAMGQEEFDPFYKRAMVALNRIVPGIADIEAEVDEALR